MVIKAKRDATQGFYVLTLRPPHRPPVAVFPDTVGTLTPAPNLDYASPHYRYYVSSPIHPDTLRVYDLSTGDTSGPPPPQGTSPGFVTLSQGIKGNNATRAM